MEFGKNCFEFKSSCLLIIEYKGEHLTGLESEKEKNEIGKLFEKKGNGNALFLFTVKKDESGWDVARQIQEKIDFGK